MHEKLHQVNQSNSPQHSKLNSREIHKKKSALEPKLEKQWNLQATPILVILF